MDDVRAVLDAVGSERASLLGLSEGGAMSTLFAATHPERTLALILMGTFAREMQAPDYPCGVSEEDLRRRLALLEEDDWASAATRDWLGRVAPDILGSPATVRWYTSYVRRGASPGATRALRLMNAEIDVRDLLPTISVPTLVLHRAHEKLARRVSIHGRAHSRRARRRAARQRPPPLGGRREALLDEIERFLSGVRKRWSQTACSPRCCSPTSSARPPGRRSSAIAPGKTCSPSTIARARAARALSRA